MWGKNEPSINHLLYIVRMPIAIIATVGKIYYSIRGIFPRAYEKFGWEAKN